MTTTEGGAPRSLRVLAIHRYFWPDTPPYASFLRAITARWVAEGHQVDVLSSQPSYKKGVSIARQPSREVLDGIDVRRLDLPPEHERLGTRLLNMLRFAWAIVDQARRRGPYDVIMASTAPPVIFGAAARIAAALTGARLVYHCMDIHPEAGRVSGEFRNPLLYRLLRAMDTSTCRNAARVVVLSRDMERAIRSRKGAARAEIRIINNFARPVHEGEQAALPEGLARKAGSFRIMFAGNLGRFQGLETAVDAMRRLDTSTPVELVFMGEGTAKEDLKARSGDLLEERIRFVPHYPEAIARQAIRTADACLVMLRRDIYRFAYPSKTMTYLAEGRPLIVSVERDSELAELVERRGVGVVVNSGDAEDLATEIRRLMEDPVGMAAMADRATRVSEEEFGMAMILDRWSSLMHELAAEPAKRR